MINEFVYCPRLFYLEWVDARWADNDDTELGRFTHRAVDRPGGRVPPPEEAEFLREARSVHVSSERLGLTAVIDRLEGDDGSVVPVDVKKGHPAPDGFAWPADRIQLLVQGALLRDAGYRVERGVLYYAQTHQRVGLDITDATDQEVIETVAAVREVAGRVTPPLPLVDSPKCVRCSLAGICLPDETNALLERSAMPPRRIVPRDPDQRPVYVTEAGSYVGVKAGRLVVTRERVPVVDIRLIDVSQLCLFGPVQVSSGALARLWNHSVPVLWFSTGGWLRGWAQGEPSKYVELRRRQVAVHGQGGLGIATRMIAGKIHNQRVMLRRNGGPAARAAVDSLDGLRRGAREVQDVASLLGVEGTAARLYFNAFVHMLGPARRYLADGFDLYGRARRPPPDPLNCLLGYCYSLLTKDLVAVCLGVGLDPYLGVLHRPRYGRPALALDLAEEFRPLIADSVVIGLLNNGEVDIGDFVLHRQGVSLTKEGRRTVLSAYERRLEQKIKHPEFGYTISYRRVLDVQARILAGVMIGDLPQYVPMTTR
jgi:CRISPR-associated protein Cas1